jgi:hypothetical protein
MKANTTPAFTMLELWRTRKEERWLVNLRRWLEAAIAAFRPDHRTFMEYLPSTGQRRDAVATGGFILGDVICDAYYFTEGRINHLATVRAILDAAWESRLPSGLVPRLEGARFAHIDDQVDFSITHRRFAELSGEKRYRERSVDLMSACIREHETADGYRTYSGESPTAEIDPKYNALMLKGYANLLTIDRPLYPDLHDLFKDR